MNAPANTNPAGNPTFTIKGLADRPSPGIAGGRNPTDATGQFERFEDLTRRLVQVPKTEIDEKRAES
jgi:hypothetical protein